MVYFEVILGRDYNVYESVGFIEATISTTLLANTELTVTIKSHVIQISHSVSKSVFI